MGLQGGVGSERFTRRSHSSLESLHYWKRRPSVQDLSNSRWEEISFLKAGSFARGEGGRARQPGSRLLRTQKGPEPTRLWALESQRAHKQ